MLSHDGGKIAIIAAMAHNRVIGQGNQLPWYVPTDLQYFKSTTWGKPIIMGRKTYQSIGRALPGRTTVIVTKDKSFAAPGCLIAHDLQQLLIEMKQTHEQSFVIGGAQIYRQVLPFAKQLYLTLLDIEVLGDVFFPDWQLYGPWQTLSEEPFADIKSGVQGRFLRLERF